MTSLTKINLDHFSLTNNKYQASTLNKPSFTLSHEQPTNQHKVLIHEISMKNTALAQHNTIKKSNTQHPNYLTFCQQYADMLCQKYSTSCNTTANSSANLKSSQLKSPASTPYSLDETITKSLILFKRYFQTIQFDFEKDYEQLRIKVKYLNSVLKTRNQSFTEKDLKVEEELEVMEMFMYGINKRICKQVVTPFALFVDEIHKEKYQKGITHDRAIRQKHTKKSPSYQHQDCIKSDSPTNQNKHSKTRSFIVSPQSPDLLQSFNNYYNNHQQNSKSPDEDLSNRNMFVSFNFHQQNQSQLKNPNASIGGDTLKYSESDFNHHQMEEEMRINLEKSLEGKEVDVDGMDDGELPFSPVQPYRLHKLYDERNLNKLNSQQNTHKTAKQLPSTSPDHSDLIQFTSQIHQFKSTLKQSLQLNVSFAKKLTSSLTKSSSQNFQLLQKSTTLLNEQKFLLNQEWNDIVDYLGKDIQELQALLIMEKAENDMKDKKFLQNLETIQTELIEELFGQKEARKAEEAMLTQVLTNMVESLENGDD